MGEPLLWRKLVLVEGKDEVNFLSALTEHMGLPDIEIRSFEGVNNLRGYLKALRAVSGFENLQSLGIIRDADANARGALESVQGGLSDAGYPVPPASLTLAEGQPRVIVLINPHEKEGGSLDDVCLHSLASHQAMTCVFEYFECLANRGITPGSQAKAQVRAFIASRDRPQVSLGVAAKRGYFPLDHDSFSPMRQLLSML